MSDQPIKIAIRNITPEGPVPSTVEALVETKRKLEELRRIVICHPTWEARLVEEVEREGLSHIVTVTGSPYVPEDTVYIAKPGLTALAAGVGLDPGGWTSKWLGDYDGTTVKRNG